MNNQSVNDVMLNQFSFLVDDLNCHIIGNIDAGTNQKLAYKNSVAGIIIDYDIRESFVFIEIYKLIDGELVKNPLSINKASEVKGFSLNDLIDIKGGEQLYPAYHYGSDSIFYHPETGLQSYFNHFAVNLKKYASEFINGDFKDFKLLQKIVNNRKE